MFCAAPTCSGSRASLLTGLYCHNNGMFGLAHRGWKLNDYNQHWVHTLRIAGYRSILIGEQHISLDPEVIGYDEVVPVGQNNAQFVAPLTIKTGQAHVHRYLRPLLERIEEGAIDPSFVISHHLPLEDAPRAYEMFKHKLDNCTKVVLRP